MWRRWRLFIGFPCTVSVTLLMMSIFCFRGPSLFNLVPLGFSWGQPQPLALEASMYPRLDTETSPWDFCSNCEEKGRLADYELELLVAILFSTWGWSQQGGKRWRAYAVQTSVRPWIQPCLKPTVPLDQHGYMSQCVSFFPKDHPELGPFLWQKPNKCNVFL